KYIDTCYFAHDCKLMADMASAIGRKAEAVHYDNLRSQILTAYRNEYLMPDCSLRETSQTAYALALAMDLLPKDMAQKSAAILAEKVRSKGVKMTTGFLGTARILPALTAAGYHSLAVQLFQSREYPSWAYEVLNGATTVWERWDSYTKEHEFNGEHGGNNAAMNSFSHYSFGAVMEWGFQSLAGIETNGAGFKKIIIKPGVSTEQVVGKAKTIDWVDASYNSIHGLIGVKWKRVGNKLHCEIVVPANTTATVILPTQNSIAVTESGLQVKIGRGITAVRTEDFITSITIGSGRYIFDSVLPTASGG
ncbi:MAG: alpha-L-rhamnosidase C-terminal domain-containing protein, partial [Chthonomonadales bacterium]